jgi:hypothetical protein
MLRVQWYYSTLYSYRQLLEMGVISRVDAQSLTILFNSLFLSTTSWNRSYLWSRYFYMLPRLFNCLTSRLGEAWWRRWWGSVEFSSRCEEMYEYLGTGSCSTFCVEAALQTANPWSWPELASRSLLLSFWILRVFFLVIIKYSRDYPQHQRPDGFTHTISPGPSWSKQ